MADECLFAIHLWISLILKEMPVTFFYELLLTFKNMLGL